MSGWVHQHGGQGAGFRVAVVAQNARRRDGEGRLLGEDVEIVLCDGRTIRDQRNQDRSIVVRLARLFGFLAGDLGAVGEGQAEEGVGGDPNLKRTRALAAGVERANAPRHRAAGNRAVDKGVGQDGDVVRKVILEHDTRAFLATVVRIRQRVSEHITRGGERGAGLHDLEIGPSPGGGGNEQREQSEFQTLTGSIPWRFDCCSHNVRSCLRKPLCCAHTRSRQKRSQSGHGTNVSPDGWWKTSRGISGVGEYGDGLFPQAQQVMSAIGGCRSWTGTAAQKNLRKALHPSDGENSPKNDFAR